MLCGIVGGGLGQRAVQRDEVGGEGRVGDLDDVLLGHAELVGQLLARRLAAEARRQPVERALKARNLLVQGTRYAHEPRVT